MVGQEIVVLVSILSNIFSMTLRRAMCLYDAGPVRSLPGLWMMTTAASFQALGKCPVARQQLKIRVIGGKSKIGFLVRESFPEAQLLLEAIVTVVSVSWIRLMMSGRRGRFDRITGRLAVGGHLRESRRRYFICPRLQFYNRCGLSGILERTFGLKYERAHQCISVHLVVCR